MADSGRNLRACADYIVDLIASYVLRCVNAGLLSEADGETAIIALRDVLLGLLCPQERLCQQDDLDAPAVVQQGDGDG